MANYVKSVVRFSANRKEDLELLLKKITSSVDYILDINKRNNNDIISTSYAVIPKEVGRIDFNILIPQPTRIYQGNINADIKEIIGAENCWDKWREENWGTMRNAHEDSVEWLDDNTLQITMWTDWTLPTNWLQTIAKYALNGELGITDIYGEYANEDFECEMGYITINEDWYEDKENEDPLCFTEAEDHIECYDLVWGDGMALSTGYFD